MNQESETEREIKKQEARTSAVIDSVLTIIKAKVFRKKEEGYIISEEIIEEILTEVKEDLRP